MKDRKWVRIMVEMVYALITELKPCPFCGGIAMKKYHNRKGLFRKQNAYPYIQCSTCGIRTELTSTEEEAEVKWNRRAEDGKR